MGTRVAGTIVPAYGDDGNQYYDQCEENDVCAIHVNIYGLVRSERLELSRIAPHAPQACLSTNSNMTAVVVGTAGIEPATPWMSTTCSTNELGAHLERVKGIEPTT